MSTNQTTIDIAELAKVRLANGRHVSDHDVRLLVAEVERLRAALTEIATGRDEQGLTADFPRERAQGALDGR